MKNIRSKWDICSRFQTSSVIRRTGEVADGKFRISEIHESGGYNNTDANGMSAAQALLKRSQSTGDIDDDDKINDAPFIDSDHSCCQEKPPEFRKINSRNFESAVYEEDDSDTTSFERTDATKNDAATLFSTSLKGGQRCHAMKELLVSSKSENFLSVAGKKSEKQLLDKRRAKFIRQKSFEVDSDSTDIDTSLTPSTEPPPQKPDNVDPGNRKPEQHFNTAGSGGSSTPSWTAAGSNRRRPDLTIKIYNSSFDTVGCDSDPIPDAFRSPTLHISGIAISRSPPGQQQQQQQQQQPQQQQQSLSPKYATQLPAAGAPATSPAPAVLAVNTASNRTRYLYISCLG